MYVAMSMQYQSKKPQPCQLTFFRELELRVASLLVTNNFIN